LPYTKLTEALFVIDVKSVYCAVRAKSLNKSLLLVLNNVWPKEQLFFTLTTT
jgi:hypothetical protein